MLKLKAEVSCDRAYCDRKQEIEIRVEFDTRGLPILVPQLPEGWGSEKDMYSVGENYYCMEHSQV